LVIPNLLMKMKPQLGHFPVHSLYHIGNLQIHMLLQTLIQLEAQNHINTSGFWTELPNHMLHPIIFILVIYQLVLIQLN